MHGPTDFFFEVRKLTWGGRKRVSCGKQPAADGAAVAQVEVEVEVGRGVTGARKQLQREGSRDQRSGLRLKGTKGERIREKSQEESIDVDGMVDVSAHSPLGGPAGGLCAQERGGGTACEDNFTDEVDIQDAIGENRLGVDHK